jgi:hypothetical protein
MSKAIAITRNRASEPSAALGSLFAKAGLVRGVETSVVLGKDADHLLVIQAIAEDGLTVETTPERRMLLEGIRRAVEQTLALQQTEENAQ